MSEDTTPRETDVTLRVRRVYNVGAYESLEISVETTDAISYSNLDERYKKTDVLSKVLLKQYDISAKNIFDGMGAIEKSGNYKSALVDAVKDNEF